MAVALANFGKTNFAFSTATPQAVTVANVSVGDVLILAANVGLANGASVQSIATTLGTTSSWTRVNAASNSSGLSLVDSEWWTATAQSSGSVTATVTQSTTCAIGTWLGDCTGASVAINGQTNSGTSANVIYQGMTVSQTGSLAIVSSFTNGVETNSTGLGTFTGGPLDGASQIAGLTYGVVNSNTSSNTGWTISSAAWVTAGIIVTPGPTTIALAASVSSSSSVSATLSVASVSSLAASISSSSSVRLNSLAVHGRFLGECHFVVFVIGRNA